MRFRLIQNSRGVTLVELIVALALTSLILVFVISGSLFVERYIRNWKRGDLLIEELSFVQRELSQVLSAGRYVAMGQDSLVCVSAAGDTRTYHWVDGGLLRDEWPLLRSGFKLVRLDIVQKNLLRSDSVGILPAEGEAGQVPFYELELVVTDPSGKADSLRCVIRNEYSYAKYSKKTATAVR